MFSELEKSNNTENYKVLNRLIKNWENEVVEFKEANNSYKQNEIGQYFSAISNEANQMTLFPTETMQYDPWILHELINNSIAHMDYSIGGRIYLNELDDEILLTNPGTFIPGNVEATLKMSYTAPFYRNQLLAETMVKFNMIDTQSMGIRKVFTIQQERYFPLPDYDLSNSNQVNVKIYGKTLDDNYTKVLFENPDFDLETVFLIDRVQKHQSITKEELRQLRKLGVVEGKPSNLYVSAKIAASIDEKGKYVKNRAFNDEAYEKWIISYLKTYKKGKKSDFVDLLKDKLSDSLSEKQKEYKVRNLLTKMKKKGIITTDSPNKVLANWILVK